MSATKPAFDTPYLRPTAEGVTITVVVSPRAKKSVIRGPYGDALRIAVAAPPADGQANALLLEFIAEILNVPKRSVTIIQGLSSTRKVIFVEGGMVEGIRDRLA